MKSCFDLIHKQDYKHAGQDCSHAYDYASEHRLNGVLATSQDVGIELNNALAMEGVASIPGNTRKGAPNFACTLARIDAYRVASSALADTTEKGLAQQVIGQCTAALKVASSSMPISQQSAACDHDATVVNPAAAEFPDNARGIHEVRTALILVSLDADDMLTNAVVRKSAGNEALDNASVVTALNSTYRTKRVACKPVPATYMFRVEFDPN